MRYFFNFQHNDLINVDINGNIHLHASKRYVYIHVRVRKRLAFNTVTNYPTLCFLYTHSIVFEYARFYTIDKITQLMH